MIKIRRFSVADLAGFSSLPQFPTADDMLGDSSMLMRMKQGYTFYDSRNDEVLMFAGYKPTHTDDGEPAGFMWSVIGWGIGSRMRELVSVCIAETDRIAVKLGYKAVAVGVDPNVKRAVKWAGLLGFARVGADPEGSGLDVYAKRI